MIDGSKMTILARIDSFWRFYFFKVKYFEIFNHKFLNQTYQRCKANELNPLFSIFETF